MHDAKNPNNILTDSFKKMSLLQNCAKNLHFIAKNMLDDSPSEILRLQNRLPFCNQIMQVLLDLGNNGYMSNMLLILSLWSPHIWVIINFNILKIIF